MEKQNKIWCLFSVENQHYQPKNNLVCFWYELTLAGIEAAMEGEPPMVSQRLFTDRYYRDSSVELRIEQVPPGVVLKKD